MPLKFKIFLIILPILILIFGVYYFSLQKQKSITPVGQWEKEETLAEKQLKELDELRQKSGDQPLSQAEIKKQLEELEKLRQVSE